MDELDGVLYRQGSYIVVVVPDHVTNGRAIDAYAVINIQTSVKEYETRFLWDAMQWAKRCNKFVNDLLLEQEDDLAWPEGLDEEKDEDKEDDDGNE